MPVVKVENGVVVQRWKDVNTVLELESKYGLSGNQYIQADATPGDKYDGSKFTSPQPDPMVVAQGIKLECQRRILEVIDYNTGMNLLAAMSLGRLTTTEQATYAKGQTWIDDMRSASRTAIQNGTAPSWPPVPDGLQQLVDKY